MIGTLRKSCCVPCRLSRRHGSACSHLVGKPAAIGDKDVADATHIVAIGCTLPEMAVKSGKAADWTDVPDDRGYGPMRDAIVRHVNQLLDPLRR